ncbi:NepR family anti-sigma factor [Sulfitobacter sp. D35]|uniref:NepR family anti-sigma factor n=1 Tax=Sulfitobacter sp. D35 TaxID=3083252 RepID=UPI00296F6FC2|nr:NepR family anti-sigma factor [Sulfitobacter sp. D35]MDW4499898.1 NepR family anti-sigma factor [Sulfitobacter sp. D35]
MTSEKDETSDRVASIIDANLKLVYSDLVQEELPDKFKDLLAVLKAQDAEAKDSK